MSPFIKAHFGLCTDVILVTLAKDVPDFLQRMDCSLYGCVPLAIFDLHM